MQAMDKSGASYGVRRAELLATASLLAVCLLMSEPARASDLPVSGPPTKAPPFGEPPVAAPSWTASAWGGYLFNDSQDVFSADESTKLGNLSSLEPGDDGYNFGLSIGHAIDENWDWKASFNASGFDDAQSIGVDGSVGTLAETKLDFQYGDLDVGYQVPFGDGSTMRLFGGVRILHANTSVGYGFDDGGFQGALSNTADFWAFGPRLGLEGKLMLGASAFSLNYAVSGSVLFSDADRDVSYASNWYDEFATRGDAVSDPVWNAEGSLALAYNFNSSASLALGYQVQQWWGLAPSVRSAEPDGDFTPGNSDVLIHGPFLKLTVTFP